MPPDYRWALRLRKVAKQARSRAAVLIPPRLGRMMPLEEFQPKTQPDCSGLYLLSENRSRKLYAGETMSLRRRLTLQFGRKQRAAWSRISETLLIQVLPMDSSAAGKLAWQSCLVRKFKERPRLNYFELRSA